MEGSVSRSKPAKETTGVAGMVLATASASSSFSSWERKAAMDESWPSWRESLALMRMVKPSSCSRWRRVRPWSYLAATLSAILEESPASSA
eukprot:2761850-Pyramimonas_sp.AAC.1